MLSAKRRKIKWAEMIDIYQEMGEMEDGKTVTLDWVAKIALTKKWYLSYALGYKKEPAMHIFKGT